MNRIKFASAEKLPDRESESIQDRIIAGRQKLYPEEYAHEVSVHTPNKSNMFDILEMVSMGIGVSLTHNGLPYGKVIVLANHQEDDKDNINKAIDYLIQWKPKETDLLRDGLPVAPDRNFKL